MVRRAIEERGNNWFVTFFVPFFQVTLASSIRVKVKPCRRVGIAARGILWSIPRAELPDGSAAGRR